MDTKKFICSTCGAELEAPTREYTFKCSYCNTVNVVEESTVIIKRYNRFAPVDKGEEYRIKYGNALYLLNEAGNYKEAFFLFRELYLIDKKNKYVLEGLIRSFCADFNYKLARDAGINQDFPLNKIIDEYAELEDDVQKVNYYRNSYNAMRKDLDLGRVIAIINAVFILLMFLMFILLMIFGE